MISRRYPPWGHHRFQMLALGMALAVTLPGLGMAQQSYEDALDDDPVLESSTFQEPEPWKEQALQLPDYPRDEDLLKLDIDAPGTPFDFFIDGRSLATGEDQVVRYIMVMKSRSGARNVIYEGIRCATSEYKTFAYGTSSGSFHPTTSVWKTVRHAIGTGRYREDLYRTYFCDDLNRSLPTDDIKKRIAYPQHRQGGFLRW